MAISSDSCSIEQKCLTLNVEYVTIMQISAGINKTECVLEEFRRWLVSDRKWS